MDTYIDGTVCPVKVLTPPGPEWREIPMDKRFTLGYPSRAFIHPASNLVVISSVEVASEPGMDKGFEYHISISKQPPSGIAGRCTSDEAAWVLKQFNLEGSEEDNHVPHGIVRNFWRPVAGNLVGIECPCKAEEQEIKEDKGDFIWRPAP